jgi:hypothetical protein
MITFALILLYLGLAVKLFSLLYVPAQIGKPREPYTPGYAGVSAIINVLGAAFSIYLIVTLTGLL